MRYDWQTGSTLVVPFGATHQHFNTGQTTARYFSAMSVHLEHMCGLHRHTQLAERGTTSHVPNVPKSPNGFDAQGDSGCTCTSDCPTLPTAQRSYGSTCGGPNDFEVALADIATHHGTLA